MVGFARGLGLKQRPQAKSEIAYCRIKEKKGYGTGWELEENK